MATEAWPTSRVEDIAASGGLVGGPFGSSLGTNDYVEDGVPVIRGQNLGGPGRFRGTDFVFVSESKAEELRRNTARPGDLVFTQRGTLGQVGVVPEGPYNRYIVSQSQMRLTVDPSVAHTAFVYYVFRSASMLDQISSHAITTGVPHINLGILGKLSLPCPPLPQQRAIAEVLGALDEKIESNCRLTRLLDSLIESEYEIAVRGTSSVGVYSALEVQMGSPFRGDAFSQPGTGRPLIRIRDLKTFRPQTWTTETRPDEVRVSPGDVLVGMDAEFRSTLWMGDPAVLNQRACRFIGRIGVGRAFALHAIRPDLAYFEGAKGGTTVIHLNKADIDRFTIPALDQSAHEALAARTEPMVECLVGAARESDRIEAVRDALLPELLSGRLRVKDAEKAAETV